MAGHSKWANIQHRKNAPDAERGKVFTKPVRAIAASGGGRSHARADNEIALVGDAAKTVARLLDRFEDLDDVQNVYSNAQLPADAYE